MATTPVMASLSSKLQLWPPSSRSVPHHISCSSVSIQCSSGRAQSSCEGEDAAVVVGRRALLSLGASLALQLGVGNNSPAQAYTQVEVGAFLPPAEGNSQFVQFVANTKDTPALRAGR